MVTTIGVSIDPGVKGCGVAEFHLPSGMLTRAAYVTAFEGSWHPYKNTALAVLFWVQENREAQQISGVDRLVIEQPQFYRSEFQKGDQADLANLTVVVGALLGIIPANSADLVLPRAWKGQTPKNIMVQRVQKVLSEGEKDRVLLPTQKGLQHNVWDAIGIGLAQLVGRL